MWTHTKRSDPFAKRYNLFEASVISYSLIIVVETRDAYKETRETCVKRTNLITLSDKLSQAA